MLPGDLLGANAPIPVSNASTSQTLTALTALTALIPVSTTDVAINDASTYVISAIPKLTAGNGTYLFAVNGAVSRSFPFATKTAAAATVQIDECKQ
jgi:hypothetical protein